MLFTIAIKYASNLEGGVWRERDRDGRSRDKVNKRRPSLDGQLQYAGWLPVGADIDGLAGLD
jgi:hypothetical protein